jgi:hypothetical protein
VVGDSRVGDCILAGWLTGWLAACLSGIPPFSQPCCTVGGAGSARASKLGIFRLLCCGKASNASLLVSLWTLNKLSAWSPICTALRSWPTHNVPVDDTGKAGNAQSQALFEAYARLQQLRGGGSSSGSGAPASGAGAAANKAGSKAGGGGHLGVPSPGPPFIPAGTSATSEQTGRVVGIIEAVSRGSGSEPDMRQAMDILQVCNSGNCLNRVVFM